MDNQQNWTAIWLKDQNCHVRNIPYVRNTETTSRITYRNVSTSLPRCFQPSQMTIILPETNDSKKKRDLSVQSVDEILGPLSRLQIETKTTIHHKKKIMKTENNQELEKK